MFDCRGMDGKIRARCFLRRFFQMQGTIREWTEEKLEGGSSQILETSDLRAVVYPPRGHADVKYAIGEILTVAEMAFLLAFHPWP